VDHVPRPDRRGVELLSGAVPEPFTLGEPRDRVAFASVDDEVPTWFAEMAAIIDGA